jgi:importin-5
MPSLLDVVVAVLQQDEQLAQASLVALIELTSTHGDIWKKCLPKLIGVVSEIIKHKDFEDATRSSTLEIITTLAENMAALLRKNMNELKTQLFPAIAQMMTEVEHADDLTTWFAEEDTEIQTKSDPASVAADTV